MGIVSISLPDELIDEMDGAIKREKARGRSAFVRAALRARLQGAIEWKGHMHGSITVSYPHGDEAAVSDVRHAFHDVVLSLMHTHCEPETCMDVLLVGGPVDRVQALHRTLERMRQIQRAILVPIVGHAQHPMN